MTARAAQLRLYHLLLWPMLGIAVLVPLTLAPPRTDQGIANAALAYAFYLLVLLGALIACRQAGIAPAEIVGPPPADPRVWRTAVLLVPLLIALSMAAMWALAWTLSWISPPLVARLFLEREPPDFLHGASLPRTLMLLNAAIFGPVVEEFVFRGVIFRRLVATRGLRTAVVVSAVGFGVLHATNTIGALAFGVVAALLYASSGTLVVPMAMHVIHNSVIALVTLLPTTGKSAPTTLAQLQAGWGPGFATLLIALALVLTVTRRLRPSAAWAVATPATMQPAGASLQRDDVASW